MCTRLALFGPTFSLLLTSVKEGHEWKSNRASHKLQVSSGVIGRLTPEICEHCDSRSAAHQALQVKALQTQLHVDQCCLQQLPFLFLLPVGFFWTNYAWY